MEELYGWVKNITCYLIFITVAVNLLPNKKYEKYIRLFAGMVLILLVVKPLTGSLRLEDKISRYFESISFQNEAEELKNDLIGMETMRLAKVIEQYQEAVAGDLEQMAQMEGFYPVSTSVTIEGDQEKENFGQVTRISMTVSTETGPQETVVEPVEKVEIGNRDQVVKENTSLNTLRKRIEEYYGLEGTYVEIQLEER
ncbi:sporulation protein [Clostridium sp. MCC353]|uniref:stage III sporulation protein AF n=1 Tax=Clostridium sp. MCC353 TaxID=2592646 RepID=UPI001C01432D|nr:stage III sporulation protein AF [Clostridium sp. MCC353]MBT9778917.1 sporulation protein [Clostridium sp. MCC353]